MMIGHPSWRWFSTGSAGVPTGGRYGNVKRFEERAKRHGLYIAWSGLGGCFVIYTKRGAGQLVTQEFCNDPRDGTPEPLTDNYLAVMVAIWERFARTGKVTIATMTARDKRERERQRHNEMEQHREDSRKDALRMFNLVTGRSGPKMFSIPAGRVGYG